MSDKNCTGSSKGNGSCAGTGARPVNKLTGQPLNPHWTDLV